VRGREHDEGRSAVELARVRESKGGMSTNDDYERRAGLWLLGGEERSARRQRWHEHECS
jgi:hypothetical protein